MQKKECNKNKDWSNKKGWKVSFNRQHYKNVAGNEIAGQPAGFCSNSTHIGYITSDMIKSHECVKKSCPYLIKNLKHPYWQQVEQKKVKKKYYQLIEKHKEEGKINKERYDLLKAKDNVKYMEDYIITNDKALGEETIKGKITLYEIIGTHAERKTQEEIARIHFTNNQKKAVMFWTLLARTINDKDCEIKGKYKVSELGRYREAFYRGIIIGKHFYMYGKGLQVNYCEEIVKKNLMKI